MKLRLRSGPKRKRAKAKEPPEPVGRPRVNYDQMPARFAAGTFDQIDALLDEGETRTMFLRVAVDEKIRRRRKERRRAGSGSNDDEQSEQAA